MPGCRPLTSSELTTIFAKSFPSSDESSFLRRFYVQTALCTGLRVSEILSLTVRQVAVCAGDSSPPSRDADGNLVVLDYILVPRRNLKGGKRIGSAVSSRTIQIGDAYRRHIKEYLLQYEVEYGIAPVGSSPLFYSRRTGSAVAARTINDALKKIFVDAGIADARDHTLASHSLRKTFAERVYEASGDNLVLTKSAMNHVSADSTLRYINPNRTVVADLQRGVGDALLDGPSMEVE